MADVNHLKVCILRIFICRMLEEDCDGSCQHSQHLSCNCNRKGDGNSCRYRLISYDNKNGRNNTGKCRVRRLCCSDIHPSESDHLKSTPKHNSGLHITENDSHQCTCNQWPVCLKRIQHTSHSYDTRYDKQQYNLNS